MHLGSKKTDSLLFFPLYLQKAFILSFIYFQGRYAINNMLQVSSVENGLNLLDIKFSNAIVSVTQYFCKSSPQRISGAAVSFIVCWRGKIILNRQTSGFAFLSLLCSMYRATSSSSINPPWKMSTEHPSIERAPSNSLSKMSFFYFILFLPSTSGRILHW